MPLLWGWKERLGDLRVVYGDQVSRCPLLLPSRYLISGINAVVQAPHASSHLTTSTSLSLLQQRDMVYGRHLSCDDQSRPSGLVLYQLGRLAWPRQHDMLPCLPFPNVEKSEVRGHQPPATAQRRFNVLLRFSGMDPGLSVRCHIIIMPWIQQNYETLELVKGFASPPSLPIHAIWRPIFLWYTRNA